jgi:hypothetical protein
MSARRQYGSGSLWVRTDKGGNQKWKPEVVRHLALRQSAGGPRPGAKAPEREPGGTQQGTGRHRATKKRAEVKVKPQVGESVDLHMLSERDVEDLTPGGFVVLNALPMSSLRGVRTPPLVDGVGAFFSWTLLSCSRGNARSPRQRA